MLEIGEEPRRLVIKESFIMSVSIKIISSSIEKTLASTEEKKLENSVVIVCKICVAIVEKLSTNNHILFSSN